jgi:NodT family efflux transporter outer membrane factor (OMF) lipoprotein
LNDLIKEALKANPDLDAAQAALRQAQQNTSAGEGAYYPQIDAGFSPSRQKQSNMAASNLSSNVYVYNLFTAGVNVSFVPDVFGGTRRQVEVLAAQESQQRFQLVATYLALTSNLVAAVIQEASLRDQIDATQDIVRAEQAQLDILHRQKDLGDADEADVLAQEALLAQAEQTLPPLQKQLAQQRDLLATLAGHFPSEDIAQKFKLHDLKLPQELPVTLPSKLVEQRPDIRVAEDQLHAASAGVGVAIANMLPQITLTGSTGSMTTQIGQLFTPGNGFWGLAAGITQPIFDGGTLLHHKYAADAAYDQAAAQYRSTVITAFQNVADTLHALDFDAKALTAAVKAEHAAAKSFEITRKELDLGQINHFALLAAEQTYQQAKINLVQAEANRYADTAALFQALGGGWWNRADQNQLSKNTEDRK